MIISRWYQGALISLFPLNLSLPHRPLLVLFLFCVLFLFVCIMKVLGEYRIITARSGWTCYFSICQTKAGNQLKCHMTNDCIGN
ncbi:hypothetical protein BDV32DRAFT_118691 [Aspergillus pseudonomiae]|nr:hypothetical protein BDV32DRAFT_118691 [Aspergillus pseudonomiae]